MAFARIICDLRACGIEEMGGGTIVPAGTVVETIGKNGQIPPPFDRLTLAVSPDLRLVALQHDNCEVVEGARGGP
jgi:hypothetical protein